MPLFDGEDLDALTDSLGQVTFTIGDVSATGYFGDADEPVLAGEGALQFGERLIGTIRADALPDLAVDAAVTVEGAGPGLDGEYIVRAIRRLENGRRVQMELADA